MDLLSFASSNHNRLTHLGIIEITSTLDGNTNWYCLNRLLSILLLKTLLWWSKSLHELSATKHSSTTWLLHLLNDRSHNLVFLLSLLFLFFKVGNTCATANYNATAAQSRAHRLICYISFEPNFNDSLISGRIGPVVPNSIIVQRCAL